MSRTRNDAYAGAHETAAGRVTIDYKRRGESRWGAGWYWRRASGETAGPFKSSAEAFRDMNRKEAS